MTHQTISATEFKAKCLSLLEQVNRDGGTVRFITRRKINMNQTPTPGGSVSPIDGKAILEAMQLAMIIRPETFAMPEVAQYMGLHPQTAREWVRKHACHAQGIGHQAGVLAARAAKDGERVFGHVMPALH